MSLYRRILSYLRPHAGLFSVSVVAMVLYAGLDAFSFTLLIPFLHVLFEGGGAAGAAGGATFGASSEPLEAGDAAVQEAAAAGVFGDADDPIQRVLNWAVGDVVEMADPMIALRNVVLVLFAVFLIKNVALYVQQYTVMMIQGHVTRDMRDDAYRHLLRLSFPFFQRTRTGQLISRVTVDVDQIRNLVTSNVIKALASAIQVAFYMLVLLLLSWKLTLIAALALPPMIGMWNLLKRRLRTGVLKVLDAVGEVASQVQETVSGVRLVKASGAEDWEFRRFQALTWRHYKALIRNERWLQFFPPATEMVIATAILGLLWYGSHLVLEEGTLGAGAFLVFLGVAMRLMSPAKFLGGFPAAVQPGLAAAERVFEIVDAPVEVGDRPEARDLHGFNELIHFENVSFDYQEGEPVLRDIELEIRPGEVVALVGPSGAGKSTLADLLPRFHDPTEGRVTLDGVDLRELKLRELRSLMGIVTQETILFHETVRANIAYGVEDARAEDIEAAARAANAHDFIVEMPRGYDTVLGERGVRLSGGQRQRIAIARALFRNPPILILDEATSALDTQSERLVQDAIDELMQDRTVLVIAHRLSTVHRADQILVLREGRIVERGTHDELLRLGGLYGELHRMQFVDG